MKPKRLDVATDYHLALLWLMARLESARVGEVMAAFEEAFGDLIPSEHRGTNKSERIKWQHYVAWSRFALVSAGLMGSGGRGVWTITQAGKEWLLENPNADSADLAAFLRQKSTESKSGFQWRGKLYTVSKQSLFSQARRLLSHGPPKEALRYRDWAVFIGDQPVSVKWLFALVTGADYNEFDSPTARRALSRIGVETQRISGAGKPSPPAARQPKGANRVKRRDEFLAQIAEYLPAQLSPQTGHGEIKSSPGRNWLQVAYREFPRSHYELRLARSFDEVAFHLEGKREDNLARLAVLAPHQEELAVALGHSVLAEPWGANWARLTIELPTALWTKDRAEQYAALLARFIDSTFPLVREAFAAVPPRTRGRAGGKPVPTDSADSRVHALLDQRLTQIRTFLQGRSSRPSDEMLCDWVQFCYTFEWFAEGYELFKLIDPSAVNDWFYERTRKLATVCHVRSG